METMSDILPDNEGLGRKMNPPKVPIVSAGTEAEKTAQKMAAGAEFPCNRIPEGKSSPTVCISRYKTAKASCIRNHQMAMGKLPPCLECAKVHVFLKREVSK